MKPNAVVTREEWLVARKQHLIKEKELTRLRDELSRQRRDLPWVKVEKNYLFEGPDGKKTLNDLFDGRSQLIVKHFMFAPGWKEGCVGCSFEVDHIDGAAESPGESHPEALTDSGREPLDSSGSCHRMKTAAFRQAQSVPPVSG